MRRTSPISMTVTKYSTPSARRLGRKRTGKGETLYTSMCLSQNPLCASTCSARTTGYFPHRRGSQNIVTGAGNYSCQTRLLAFRHKLLFGEVFSKWDINDTFITDSFKFRKQTAESPSRFPLKPALRDVHVHVFTAIYFPENQYTARRRKIRISIWRI